MPAFAGGVAVDTWVRGRSQPSSEPSTLPLESESTERGAEERGPVRFEGARNPGSVQPEKGEP